MDVVGYMLCKYGHYIIRLDRANSSGGGVAVLIKQGIRYSILPHPKTSIIEAIGVNIHTEQGDVKLFAVYAPRQCVDSNGTSALFADDLRKLTDDQTRYVVAGDLNARHPQWRNHIRNKNGALLADHLSSGTCDIHFPDDPTFLSPAGTPSTLDVFLSDLPISKPTTIHDLSSDHYPVVCKLECTPTPARPAMRRDYHRVNWVSLSRIVDSRIPDQPDLPTIDAIDNQLEAFENAVHQAEEACIREVPVRRQFTAIDDFTRQLIQQRNVARRQFQRSGCLLKKEEVSVLNANIRDRMTVIRNEQFASSVTRMEDLTKPFWKVAKILKKRPKAVPPLKDNGELLVSPPEKANAIASKLVEAHNLGAGMLIPHEDAVQRTIALLDAETDAPFGGRVSEDEANVPDYLTRILRSYLSERKFQVHLSGAVSEVQDVAAGVPQADCKLALYADDSAIIANGRTPAHYRSRLQQGVSTYVAYLASWKIKVNESKTQAILFRHRLSPKLLPPPDCYVRVNGCIVPWLQEVIYLGVIFDCKLLYRAHTDSLKGRCTGLLKALYPLIARRSRLSRRNKLALLKSVIAPVVNYAMAVWGKCAATHKQKLQVVQNRLLRIILDVPHDTRTRDLHRIADYKTVEQRIEDSLDRLFLSATASEYPLIRALAT
ncbi:hypothetical protein quinque_006761 [Culex quinquefasciatus]